MINIYPYNKLGHARHGGWLDTRHHFSFGDYYNSERMGFGALRVINDDVIKAGSGFGMHPHKDMEIITFVRKGAITHRDSRGNEGRTEAGDVQVMSAGTGIFHSEYNMENEETTLFQIWIEPNQKGVTPRWDAAQFSGRTATSDGLPLLVSGRPEDEGKGALFIHQNASLYGGRISTGASVTQTIKDQAYLLVSSGTIEVLGQTLSSGDGMEITGTHAIELRASDKSGAEVIVIDVPASAMTH